MITEEDIDAIKQAKNQAEFYLQSCLDVIQSRGIEIEEISVTFNERHVMGKKKEIVSPQINISVRMESL